ncbi:MAG: hypothetical protein K1X53_04630 [Candidatus Sumerlaeaceae bacterium]|nr:hypothetical protein [Candidatus Sumerlaeaceae bacterium]
MTVEQVLHEMDRMEWATFRTLSGDASHVPAAIRALISDIPAQRSEAYWKLDNHVVCQGDLYESAFYVCAAFANLLKTNVIHGRAEMYALLSEIVLGCPAVGQETLETKSQPHQTPAPLNGLPSTIGLLEGCLETIAGCHALIIADALTAKDGMVRKRATELLNMLVHTRPDLLPFVLETLEEQTPAAVGDVQALRALLCGP